MHAAIFKLYSKVCPDARARPGTWPVGEADGSDGAAGEPWSLVRAIQRIADDLAPDTADHTTEPKRQ
jgi:hypothetical protein